VISDVVMPNLDGFGLCQRIKADAALKETPVILLTSLSGPQDVISGLQCGADYFIRKPYEAKRLLSRIEHILANGGLRAESKMRPGIEVLLAGQRYFITSERQQILDLLISTYEEAVRLNEELVTANQRLEARNRDIERASKFKDQFLSTMSHELRTPLNAILGFSELLAGERCGPLNDRQRRYVTHVHTGGRHLLRLINDILDLSKIEAGRLELELRSVPVEGAFRQALDALSPMASKKSHRLASQADSRIAVRADPTRLHQILMNLAGNAIKFTPDGGAIELAARRVEGGIRLEVRDSGPGIPPEEQKRIFEAFYRLKHAGQHTEGTGLGLAITQRLVELHGDSLNLESAPGQGSRFYFHLPEADRKEARYERLENTLHAVPAKAAGRILVVEDDPSAAQLIRSQLSGSGYEAVLCETPSRTLEVAAEMQPAAITLDLLMKPTPGLDLLAQLKGDPRTREIPVIVVTIMNEPAVGALLGADEYLVKPVDAQRLIAALGRCINSRTVSGQIRPILVVEDHEATREAIAELLRTAGYTVVTARDGAEGRRSVNEALPEIVLLDLHLPGVCGFELLREWRASPRTADLPVFVLTAKNLTAEEEAYLRAHTESLFLKDQQWPEALIQQLGRVLRQNRPGP
jgi:signal transduction histidine kinase/ActR/RegA family two-component response regulator